MKRLLPLLVLFGAMIAGCGNSNTETHSSANLTPKAVTVAQVERTATGAQDEIMGSVTARNTAEISTKVQARIDRIPVDIGSRVRKGDLLAELDTRETQARVQQAKAVYEQASIDLGRYEALLKKQAATQQEYDAVKARAAVAEATLNEAEALLSYAHITAPFTGVVTAKMVDVGDLTFPGQPLFTLEETGAQRFVVTIAESYRNKIEIGQSVSIKIPVLDTAIAGRVEELSPSADPISRTFTVKIGMPTLDALRPGQFGRLLLSADDSDETLFIPRSALVRRGQLDLVYVVSPDKKAMLRLVRIGRQFPDKLEILSGLRENETVVISDQRDLVDGDAVQVAS